jgi:predicted chitinase
MNIYYGVIENRQDPLQLGRCQVRVVGLHTHDKNFLPTVDLPWAVPIHPITSAAMNGIGQSPIGPVEGTSVIIMFADDDLQQPIMLGALGGISSRPGSVDADDVGSVNATPKLRDIELLTIDGPVTGNTLTFIDKENGKTNLTNGLRADMGIIGFALPSNTKIVSILNGTQITISTSVNEYKSNIITFSDIPSNLEAVKQSQINRITNPTPVSTPNDATTTTSVAAEPTASPVNTEIPTIPPAKSTSDVAKSTEGIKALIAACDRVGLTTKEQKCALLAIAGGESKWIPQKEGYIYSSIPNFKRVFSFLTDAEAERYSSANKKGITREQFFSVIYGPTKRGSNFLGNKTDADGGRYYGRGFIQLTGRYNYQRYQDMAQNLGITIDIVNNPDSLNDDINISATIAALYIKATVVDKNKANPTDHPGFFLAARKAVGVNAGDGYAHKAEFYEYFYGQAAGNTAEKDAAPPVASPPTDYSGTPGPSMSSENTASNGIGFRDPNNKYPLEEYINEVDTNRLARGIIEGTVVEIKDKSRVRSVPKAIINGTWSQPEAPFGAQYPYNKVFETESGHIQEFDDTPGQERIHTYHRSGTYSEIDSNGTQVNYIIGDNYVLMERNGNIHVAGDCNITVDGNTNIFARTDANIEVAQNANIKVGNNLELGVHNDVNMAVGGNYNLNVVGDYNIQAANVKTKASADIINHASAGHYIKGETVNTEATTAMSVKSESLNQEASGSMDIKSGGAMNVDYSEGHFGEGANGASGALDIEVFELAAPPAGEPQNKSFSDLVPPERKFEDLSLTETPEDFNTPEGRRVSTELQNSTDPNAVAPVSEETAPAPVGGSDRVIPVNCDIIYTTQNFTNDYTLSQNFSLGMLIDGGVSGKHKLVDQMIQEGDTEKMFTVQEIVCNLAQCAQNILEPLLEILPGGIGGYRKQWKINSGYRLQNGRSDHRKGRAIDIGLIYPSLQEKTDFTYDFVQKMEKLVPYDQLILEYRGPQSVWIHCSYNGDRRKKMAFTMLEDKTYRRNAQGYPEGFYKINL